MAALNCLIVYPVTCASPRHWRPLNHGTGSFTRRDQIGGVSLLSSSSARPSLPQAGVENLALPATPCTLPNRGALAQTHRLSPPEPRIPFLGGMQILFQACSS